MSAWLGLAGGVLLAALMSWSGSFSTGEWVFFALLGIACLFVASKDTAYDALAWLATTLGAAALLFWGEGWAPQAESAASSEPIRFLSTLIAFGAIHAVGSLLPLKRAPHPGRWAARSAVTVVIYFSVAFEVLERGGRAWGVTAIALAALLALSAFAVSRIATAADRFAGAIGWLASGSATLIMFAVPIEFDRELISVAWAIQVTALVWLARVARVRALRWFACGLLSIVAVRLLANPFVMTYPISEHVLFNWIPYGYGVPIFAFIGTAAILDAERHRALRRASFAVALALGFAALSLLARHLFHPAEMLAAEITLREGATYVVLWLSYSGLLLTAGDKVRFEPSVTAWGSRVAAIAGLFFSIYGIGLFLNPWIVSTSVGEKFLFNALLWTHALPALLATALAVAWQQRSGRIESAISGVVALLLWFLYANTCVRQAFHGDVLTTGSTTNAELYAYSATWIGFGIALLLLGIARRNRLLRIASLVVMSAAVAKVFVFDTSHLRDLYRVFSFLGLGLSLLLLAHLYRRFVVPTQSPPE